MDWGVSVFPWIVETMDRVPARVRYVVPEKPAPRAHGLTGVRPGGTGSLAWPRAVTSLENA